MTGRLLALMVKNCNSFEVGNVDDENEDATLLPPLRSTEIQPKSLEYDAGIY